MTVQRRWTLVVQSLLAALTILSTGCSRDKPPSRKPAPVLVSTDIEKLREIINVPSIPIRNGRWVEMPLGQADESSLLPGPTDLGLYVYLELDAAGWTELEQSIGPAQGTRTIVVRTEIASAILGPVVTELPDAGAARAVTGPKYDASKMRRGTYRPGGAIRFHDGLLMTFAAL
ncbi:hypothetical protein LZC95_22400 [Pendulispora brunnea]|uniref:Uncharacterized protein n=1 Tax=Pendulispora brunnea TaxID=2905690 RepID=A0ABZ2KLL1_9BACT